MKILKKAFIPVVAVAINVILAVQTGSALFAVMAGVIVFLLYKNVRTSLRQESERDAQK